MQGIAYAQGSSVEYITWSEQFWEDLVALDRVANHRNRITCIAVQDLLKRIGEFSEPRPRCIEWEELYACAFAIVGQAQRSQIAGDATLATRFARVVQFLKDNAELARLRSA